jgi:hypothetical protein
MRQLQEVQRQLREEEGCGVGSAYSGMTESRVDRLLRLAEQAVLSDEFEKADTLVNIAQTALEVRQQELEEIQKMMATSERDDT